MLNSFGLWAELGKAGKDVRGKLLCPPVAYFTILQLNGVAYGWHEVSEGSLPTGKRPSEASANDTSEHKIRG